MKKIKPFGSPLGVDDILPNDHDYITFLKKVIRHRFRQSGFRRITTPVFENAELFHNSLGLETDIIKRELYNFKAPRGDEIFALRPELTTGIIRSFIENKIYEGALPMEFYSIGRCYRFERPQTRIQREFWQVGAEILGESDPAIDAQLIYLVSRILKDLKLSEFCELKINTIGNLDDRQKFVDALENFYTGKERNLSPRSREKFEQKQFLSLLTPANENEEVLVKMAPKITDFLSPKSHEFFKETLGYLDSFKISYKVDHSLIRPLEYYSQTIFEFHEKETDNKIFAGGRYDGLIAKLGGPDLGGCGFAGGLGRIINLMKKYEINVPYKDNLQIYVAATGPMAKKQSLPILIKLREHGFHAIGALGGTSMEEQMKRAEKFKVPFAVLMGDVELRKKTLIIRNVVKGTSRTINQEDLLSEMDKLLGGVKNLDTLDDFLDVT